MKKICLFFSLLILLNDFYCFSLKTTKQEKEKNPNENKISVIKTEKVESQLEKSAKEHLGVNELNKENEKEKLNEVKKEIIKTSRPINKIYKPWGDAKGDFQHFFVLHHDFRK